MLNSPEKDTFGTKLAQKLQREKELLAEAMAREEEQKKRLELKR